MRKHLHYNYNPIDYNKKEFVISGLVAAGLSVGWAIAGGVAIYAAAATIAMSASNSHQQRKAAKSAAHAADIRAQEIARKQSEAKAAAEKAARDKTRRRILAIEESNTHLTKEEDLEDPLIQTPTLLGV